MKDLLERSLYSLLFNFHIQFRDFRNICGTIFSYQSVVWSCLSLFGIKSDLGNWMHLSVLIRCYIQETLKLIPRVERGIMLVILGRSMEGTLSG